MHGSSTTFPQVAVVAGLALAFACGAALSASAPSALLFRIFLKNGGALVSYGEFSRISDRVVLSVPIGDVAKDPHLQIVSIPESTIDWEKTDSYANTVRARHYASTRGEDDFALLVGQVTAAVSQLAMTADPVRRLAMAEEARRNLAAWPAANHGFKAAEVAHLLTLFDDAITELRAAAGETSFDLSLVAMTQPPPAMELLPAPDALTTMELAYDAAMLTVDAAERASLLQALAASLASATSAETSSAALRARVSRAMAAEAKIDDAYASLAKSALADASARADRADVRGLRTIVARVLRADETLGRKRPGEVASLLATLDLRLGEARRLQLARDAWAVRVEAVKAYQTAILPPLERLRSFRKWLEHVRDRSGPDPKFLRPLEDRARLAHLELIRVPPPPEAEAIHRLLAAAFHMTRHAAVLRRNAISSNDGRIAWDASAAAVGAITLGERAVDELQRLISSQPTR